MTETQLGDAAAEEFGQKVTISIDPECEGRFPAETLVRVTVHARGQQFVSAITAPRGESVCPPTWGERLEKFGTATAATLTAAAQRRWLESFSNLRDGRLADLRGILASRR